MLPDLGKTTSEVPGEYMPSRHWFAHHLQDLSGVQRARLLLDLNRAVDAVDSIVEHSEDTPIPGNIGISAAERAHRCQWLYEPFHRELSRIVDQRLRIGTPTALLSVHSFTPSYLRSARPWHAGVVSARDRRLADPMLAHLRREPALVVGDNEPYAAADGVYHTLQRHAEARGLPSVLLEIRNDQIEHAPGRALWADRLVAALRPVIDDLPSPANSFAPIDSIGSSTT